MDRQELNYEEILDRLTIKKSHMLTDWFEKKEYSEIDRWFEGIDSQLLARKVYILYGVYLVSHMQADWISRRDWVVIDYEDEKYWLVDERFLKEYASNMSDAKQ